MNDCTESFKALSKNIRKITRLFEEYSKLKMNPTENVYKLEKNLLKMRKVAEDLPDYSLRESLVSWLNEIKGELEKTREDFKFQFGKHLKELLQKDGKKVRGQYPLLRIGLFTLRLNFEFGEATLYFGPEVEKLRSKIPIQPTMVYEMVKKYDDALHATKSTPEDILKTLHEAYCRKLTLENKTFGEKILITEVLSEFILLKQSKRFYIDPQKSHFREYSRAQLSYLLYRLKKSTVQEKDMKLYVATFDATVDKMHSIWIPENEEGEGTYYSHISFEQ